MKAWLLLLSFLCALPAFAEAPTVRVLRADGGRFRFEVCEKSQCKPLGRDEGYTREELERWKKFRENTVGDIAPMMGFVALTALAVAGIAFFPVTAAVTGLLAVGGLSYFFYHSPQVQAGMPNDVYQEFAADPGLLPELKEFLAEIDQGKPVLDQSPRVLSGPAAAKGDSPAPASGPGAKGTQSAE